MLFANISGLAWVIFSFNDFLNAAQCSSNINPSRAYRRMSDFRWEAEKQQAESIKSKASVSSNEPQRMEKDLCSNKSLRGGVES